MAETIILDAGHGGLDNGAVYRGRREKDDTLKLTKEVGDHLRSEGYEVKDTRTTDEYHSPFEKAQIGNRLGGDVFLSIHRNITDDEGSAEGVEAYIFKRGGIAEKLAEQMLYNLEKLGFENHGIKVRTGLAVLRRTKMPAIILEVGYLNSPDDNRMFDEQFEDVADAIAEAVEDVMPIETRAQEMSSDRMQREQPTEIPDGRMQREQPMEMPGGRMEREQPTEMPGGRMGREQSMEMPEMPGNAQREDQEMPNDMRRGNEEMPTYEMGNPMRQRAPEMQHDTMQRRGRVPNGGYTFWVQTGVFRFQENAMYQKELLEEDGYKVEVVPMGNMYAVRVGPFQTLENAADWQNRLREIDYDTLVVTE